MPHVQLGRTGLRISRVILGSMRLAEGGGDQRSRVRTIHHAIELGMTSIDTAPLYGFGAGEQLVGRAIADRRDSVQVLTKVGLRWDADHGVPAFETTSVGGGKCVVRMDSRPESVRLEIERSLRRLGTETIDLAQVHRFDRLTPVADTMGELRRLRDEGKVREIGVSNYLALQALQANGALGEVPLASNQVDYSLLNRDVEDEIAPILLHAGVGLLCYSPLAHGALATGRLPPALAASAPRYARCVLGAVEQVLGAVGHTRGASPGAVALAWLLHQPGVTAVVSGCSTDAHVGDNAPAGSLALSRQELTRIRDTFEAIDPDQDLGAVRGLRNRARGAARRMRRRIAVARATWR